MEMAFFIVETRCVEYLKYIVEADSPDEAVEKCSCSEEEYIGYVGGDPHLSEVYGPFASRAEAVSSDVAEVER